ncbi:TSUP family transporter [Helicobacter kayseriensis]|uniref:TSUP family transporter n=1 Tax=Helicobacter kayseriensis TaxID=2905877 RepID=UPI001E649028|nr:TSUP family transporter [Helicobacter kayseriensis]MCE3046578.1 TSUP family transporter [Helicobacter kayseriensis]MCE3048120.1 TSUP family transporter [Helicobacter kayseriensis]
MEAIGFETFVFLFGIAFCAGAIDVIAGGGGLLTIPALMLAGISPLQALATNKVQSMFSPLYATYFFFKKGMFDFRSLWIALLFSVCGACFGVMNVGVIDQVKLEKMIAIVLGGVALFCLISPQFPKNDTKPKVRWLGLPFFVCFLGFYDGFLGAGAGIFLTLMFVILFGMGAIKAVAHAKLFNLASNFASFCVFALSGWVIWKIGVVMAIGTILGSLVGSRLVYLHAEKIIKPIVILVALGMCVKILYLK